MAKGSASQGTSPSGKGNQDTGPKSVPVAGSSGNKPSSAPNVNDNDRTATNDNAMTVIEMIVAVGAVRAFTIHLLQIHRTEGRGTLKMYMYPTKCS